MTAVSVTLFSIDVNRIMEESIEAIIGGKTYNPHLAKYWANLVVQYCLRSLCTDNSSHKYICNCIILQKKCTGFDMASSCFWNNSSDFNITIRWDNDTMYCVLNLYGIPTEQGAGDAKTPTYSFSN